MRDDHVGESAERYALGDLDDFERGRVERHARECDACAKLLGQAEATVLRLIEGGEVPERLPEPKRRIAFGTSPRTRAPAWFAAAVAAAFVLGLLPWGIASLRERGTADSASQQQQQQVAMNAMLAGHFAHAPFVSHAAGVPPAKLIFAREGGWLYVIVGPGADPLDIAVVTGGKRTTVASVAPAAVVRSAFIRQPTRVESVELVDRGVPIAVAHVAYAAQNNR